MMHDQLQQKRVLVIKESLVSHALYPEIGYLLRSDLSCDEPLIQTVERI